MEGTASIKRGSSLLSHWTLHTSREKSKEGILVGKGSWLHIGIAIGPVRSYLGGNALSTSHRILLCY